MHASTGRTICGVLHELWVYEEGQTFCLAGQQGEQARALMPDDAALTWTVDADSHFEAMTKYHEHMGWGTYTTQYPEIDKQTYVEWGFEGEWCRMPDH
jgi:hypothetical protein